MIYQVKSYETKKEVNNFSEKPKKDLYEKCSEWFYFDNLKTALKVARLKAKSESVKCKICVIKKEKAQHIPRELIVSSIEEYLALTTKKTNTTIEKLMKDLKEPTK